jgi:hypothetical protein
MRSELRNKIIEENKYRNLLQELFSAHNTQNDFFKFHGADMKNNWKRVYSHTVNGSTKWMYFSTNKEAYNNLKNELEVM